MRTTQLKRIDRETYAGNELQVSSDWHSYATDYIGTFPLVIPNRRLRVAVATSWGDVIANDTRQKQRIFYR